jgi:urease accessory protein
VGGGGALSRLYQEGSAKVRFCASGDGVRETVLINTAGGLTGGDRFEWDLELEAGASCRATTQACEKVYRSAGPPARVTTRLSVAAGASLEWLPQETILFRDAHIERSFDIAVEPGGRLLVMEAVILGRQAMGETEVNARLRDRWRVRSNGRLIFADALSLDDPVRASTRRGLLDGAQAFASILLVGEDAEDRLGALRASLGEAGGASAFGGKLFSRILAPDGLALRRTLTCAAAALLSAGRLPRLWTV